MESYPQWNATTSCRTAPLAQLRSCYGRGRCQLSKLTATWECSCAPLYDPASHCAQTVFAAYHGADLAYALVTLALVALLCGVFLFELVGDVCYRGGVRVLRKIASVAKLLLLLGALLYLLHVGVWLWSLVHRVGTLGQLSFALRALAGVLVSFAYLVVCVAWFDLLLKSKRLGSRTHALRLVRLAVLILIALTVPASIVLHLLAAAGVVPDVLVLVGQILAGVSLAVAFGSTFYYLLVLTRALRHVFHAHSKSQRVQHLRQRTRFLIAASVLVLASLARVLLAATLPEQLPRTYLTLLSWEAALLVASLTALYLFLQNFIYDTRHGCCPLRHADARRRAPRARIEATTSSTSGKLPSSAQSSSAAHTCTTRTPASATATATATASSTTSTPEATDVLTTKSHPDPHGGP